MLKLERVFLRIRAARIGRAALVEQRRRLLLGCKEFTAQLPLPSTVGFFAGLFPQLARIRGREYYWYERQARARRRRGRSGEARRHHTLRCSASRLRALELAALLCRARKNPRGPANCRRRSRKHKRRPQTTAPTASSRPSPCRGE